MLDSPSYLFVVAAAMVAEDGKILVQQRPSGKPMAGLWEFPGGKVEQGETPEIALARELAEELGVSVQAGDLKPVTFASEPLGERHLILLLYLLRQWEGVPESRHASAIAWVTSAELRRLEMPPADLPFADSLEALL